MNFVNLYAVEHSFTSEVDKLIFDTIKVFQLILNANSMFLFADPIDSFKIHMFHPNYLVDFLQSRHLIYFFF